MPGTLGIMPILPPPPKGGAGKPPRAPRGAGGVRGATTAFKPAPVRGAVTAFKQTTPREVRGGAAVPVYRRNPLIAQIGQEQRSQRLQEGKARRPSGGGSDFLGTVLGKVGEAGNVLGEVAGKGAQTIIEHEAPGVQKLGTMLGVNVAKTTGTAAKEAITIPAQTFPAVYHGGKALGEARAGHPGELEHLGDAYLKESALAHFFKGEFDKALNTAKEKPLSSSLEVTGAAGLGDRLLAGLDRAAAGGAAGEKIAGGGGAAAEGATVSRPPRPYPRGMAPKELGAPQKPYNKGLIRGGLERRHNAEELSTAKGEKALRGALDTHEAEILAITRNSNAEIDRLFHGTRRKPGPLNIPGREALHHFSKWLANPEIRTKDGGYLYRKQIAEAIEHWKQTPPEEIPHQGNARRDLVAQLEELQAHPHEHFTEAYQHVKQLAAYARSRAPEFQSHGVYSHDTMRITKLIAAFQHHFRDQNPWVDPTVRQGESPFYLGHTPENARQLQDLQRWEKEARQRVSSSRSRLDNATPEQARYATEEYQNRLAEHKAAVQTLRDHSEQLPGRQVPIDEVVKKLADEHGVSEDQLIFSSTRPFQTEAKARVTGMQQGGRKEHVGQLTGVNFKRGYWDSSPEALHRQFLTNQKALDIARATADRSRLFLRNHDLADLLEHHMATHDLRPEEQAAYNRLIDEFRGRGNHFFEDHPGETGRSAAAQAMEAERIFHDIGYTKLRAVRVAHRYASTAYRQALGENLNELADMQDRLEPSAGDHLPDSTVDENTPKGSGPIALAHSSVADRIREYENNLGQAHLKQLPASIWRMGNVALSPRHPLGVSQEMGIRALASWIGAFSLMRGTKLRALWREAAEHSSDPNFKYLWQRIESHTGGTHAGFTISQSQHIPLKALEQTWVGRPKTLLKGKTAETGAREALSPVDAWLKGETHKLTGFPLRAVKHVVGATNKITKVILREQSRFIEHPPTVAGLGKHYAEEYKRLTGRRMPMLRSFNQLERELMRGLLSPTSVDTFARHAMDYWGDWKNAPPSFRRTQAAIPFFRWYVNALRFVYHIMPVDHPIQTGLLVALETATREQRQAEGQEFRNLGQAVFSKVSQGGVAPGYQQGSIPNIVPEPIAALEGRGGRMGQEYYSMPGATSQGLTDSVLGAVFPYATAYWYTMQGIDPTTHEPIEEPNPETGKTEPISDMGKLAVKAALTPFESFGPPIRWVTEATGVGGEKPKAIPYIFRPFRTEKERIEFPKRGEQLNTTGLSPRYAQQLEAKVQQQEQVAKEKARENRKKPLGGKVGGKLGGTIGGPLP